MATRRPALTQPGDQYDPQYFRQLIRMLDAYFATLDNSNDLTTMSLPGSGYGLPPGALWNNNGSVQTVSSDSGQAYVGGVQIRTLIGTVTVSVS